MRATLISVSDSTEGSGNFELRALVQQKIAERRRQRLDLAPPKPKPRPSANGMAEGVAAIGVALVIAGGLIFSNLSTRSRALVPPPVAALKRAPLHAAPIRAGPIRAKPRPYAPPHLPLKVVALASVAPAHRHHRYAAAPKRPAWHRRSAPSVPMPRLVSLFSPPTVLSGAPVRIAFNASGSVVRVIAKIGPTEVADTMVDAEKGKLSFPAPHSRHPRVLTVNVYVERGNRTDSASRTIVVLPPA